MAYKKLKFWFDEELAALLSDKITGIDPTFDRGEFIKKVKAGVDDLELKDRVALIARELHHLFSYDYPKGVSSILEILGPENEEETGMFTNFYWVMPLAKYVEDYGLDHFNLSMKALEEITKRNTSEYAIRPFIKKYPNQTMAQLYDWASHSNFHVRRLASEGGRPRLPWASKLDLLIRDPKPLYPILDQLKDDHSKYVQKSVANCLNDLFKDNYAITRQRVDQWVTGASKQRKWIIKHSTRTLRKSGDSWALELYQSIQ